MKPLRLLKRLGTDMKMLIAIILFCLLLVVCWPLALLVAVAFPILWLVSIPFRVVGAVVGGIVSLIGAILGLPARLVFGSGGKRQDVH